MALNISAWSIRNPLPSVVFSIILLALGWLSFTRLAVTHLPSSDIPVISVSVAQFGAAPAELESQVTKVIEDGVSGVEGVRHKLDGLRRHCDDVGRDYDEIEKTMIGGVSGGPDPVDDTDAFLADMEGYVELGISLVTIVPPADDPVGWTAALCERVVPRLAGV